VKQKTAKQKIVSCPTCGKDIIWSKENPWRPFCCKRCKLIDLGDWASETHRIKGETIMPENLIDPDNHE